MYQPNFEYLVELHRREILDETERVHADEFRPYRPGLFAHAMFDLANWMIHTGKQLRRRYEIPATACGQPARGSFAH